MTSGPILRHLVLFALPLMLGNVFQMLYHTVDSIIVGNFVSKQALAAVGSTTPIVNMMVFFFNGFSVGAGVVIGRSFGARDMKKLHTAVQTTMAATFVISLLFTVLGVAGVRPLLRLRPVMRSRRQRSSPTATNPAGVAVRSALWTPSPCWDSILLPSRRDCLPSALPW